MIAVRPYIDSWKKNRDVGNKEMLYYQFVIEHDITNYKKEMSLLCDTAETIDKAEKVNGIKQFGDNLFGKRNEYMQELTKLYKEAAEELINSIN